MKILNFLKTNIFSIISTFVDDFALDLKKPNPRLMYNDFVTTVSTTNACPTNASEAESHSNEIPIDLQEELKTLFDSSKNSSEEIGKFPSSPCTINDVKENDPLKIPQGHFLVSVGYL